MANRRRSFADGYVRQRISSKDIFLQSPPRNGGVPAPDTSSHSIKPSKMKRQSAGRHGERLDSGIHYHCNTLPRMSSTVCANEPEERMRRERKMGSASQPISTSSSLTRTPYKRDNNTLSLGGVATSHETTPITSVSRRTLNEQILLPLVGQRSGGMRKKSDVQFPWQPKNLSLGGVGVARAWGMSVRRRRRMWSSACEDVEEEVTAEDNSSISDSVEDQESRDREDEELEPEEDGGGFSVEDLTDFEEDEDTAADDSKDPPPPPPPPLLPHPLPHHLSQQTIDKDVATYVLLKRASQQLELLSVTSDSCDEDGEDQEEEEEEEKEEEKEEKEGVTLPAEEDKELDIKVTDIGSTGGEKIIAVETNPSPPLTPSLFPGVEPTIHFPLPNEPYTPLPPSLRRLLKWKMSTITPNIIKGCLTRVGFTSCSKGREWLGYWGKHMKSEAFRAIKSYQKVNHFPGTFEIGRKDRLWRNLSRLQSRVGRKNVDFVPLTFVLPGDVRMLKREWVTRDSGRQKWILKPPASARGIGVRVVHKWNQIPKKRPLIVQRYISDPLLIRGNKIDLRVYVYVTSYDPLTIYVFPDGLTRFATSKYSSSTRTLSNRFIHLTNYSINKKNSKFSQNSDETACQGHKWSLHALWRYMRSELGIDTTPVWNSIIQLVIKTIISSEAHCSSLVKTFVQRSYSCHELFGFDIVLDRRLKPWLVEVNISPSLHSNSRLDVNIKGRMIRDLLNIAGFKLPRTTSSSSSSLPLSSSSSLTTNTTANDSRHQDGRQYVLTAEERRKHFYFLQRGLPQHERKNILDRLTPGDIAVLMQAEDEFSRRGLFERVFPSQDSHQYKQYFESQKYNNILLEQWMMKYQKCPEKGLKLLRGLCSSQRQSIS